LRPLLSPNGAAFIHHSNMGRYTRRVRLIHGLPQALRGRAARWLSINDAGARDTSMTAHEFKRICDDCNMACFSQELLNWNHGRCLIDCFSCIGLKCSVWDRPIKVLENPHFVEQSRIVKSLAPLYADAECYYSRSSS